MVVKSIYITYEKGLDALAPYITEAISEVMEAFPAEKMYQEHFPIVNLGNWKADDYLTRDANGNVLLEAYKSIQWYIERAKRKAMLEHRWLERKQISIDQLYQDLHDDPYAKKIPQYSLLITRHDLYGTGHDGRLLNFCNGVTKPGRFAIISTARFLDENNKLDIDRFQSVVMHEFGHLIGLTPSNRVNSYEQLGTHCRNGDIMEQDMSGTGRVMTENRLRRKRLGHPPICSDCIAAGRKFLDKEIANAYFLAQQRQGRRHL